MCNEQEKKAEALKALLGKDLSKDVKESIKSKIKDIKEVKK